MNTFRGLLAIPFCVFFIQGIHAQGTGPLYVVDGEFDGGQTSTLYRVDPGSGEVLETIGDTGEHLLAIAVDPVTGDIIGLTAPDSANADSHRPGQRDRGCRGHARISGHVP